MRKILCLILTVCFILSACTAGADRSESESTEKTEYTALKEIDRSVMEPDLEEKLSDNERKLFRDLVDSAAEGKPSASLTKDEEKNSFLIDLLRQSPYFFLVDDYTVSGDCVEFTYVYPKDEQKRIVDFMDSEFLTAANYKAAENDSDLDSMLKIYSYVTGNYVYDTERTDNKQLDSPLFKYPADEIYKMLRDGKTLCFGFAYLVRFCSLQHGVRCFNICGYCRATESGHMWNMFEYDGEYFNCDAGWDISDEGYSKLMHFGKTDNERRVDSLEFEEFKKERFEAMGGADCDDERFKIFRGIKRFTYIRDHEYFMVDGHKQQYIFNSETFEMR